MARGLIIAAPHSGSGKTLVTLGLCRALADGGFNVAPAKAGPDYIDPQFLTRAARRPAINLDSYAMSPRRLLALANQQAGDTGWLIVEGVMGLFDGAAGGGGTTADLAAQLHLPVVLVIDCSHMAQSVAAIAEGFARFRDDVTIGGVVLNRVASERHERMLRDALSARGIVCLGALYRDDALEVPGRHLGLTQPGEVDAIEDIITTAANEVGERLDFTALDTMAASLQPPANARRLPPLGQTIAIAYDAAFSFVYRHWLEDWYQAGAELSFFSPLNNEKPAENADAVFLPGGYPELHGRTLAEARDFRQGLRDARDRGALIYGECGGYMVLGSTLTDHEGDRHAMTGLLPHATKIDRPRRALGYRQLRHQGPLPFARTLAGHEFHYSEQDGTDSSGQHLFTATDSTGKRLPPMGLAIGKVCGSYAHIIDAGGE